MQTVPAIEFRELIEKDLDQVAELHIREMPEDLLSQLGKIVVRDIFHRAMLSFPNAVTYVAVDGDRVVGMGCAQIDFEQFSYWQKRKDPFFYLSRLGLAFALKPWLIPKAFAARQYLSKSEILVNLGPLAVAQEYRDPGCSRKSEPNIAGKLTEMLFQWIFKRAPESVTFTMIRPNNFGSISAVNRAARNTGFKMIGKERIFFLTDERIIFKYAPL